MYATLIVVGLTQWFTWADSATEHQFVEAEFHVEAAPEDIIVLIKTSYHKSQQPQIHKTTQDTPTASHIVPTVH